MSQIVKCSQCNGVCVSTPVEGTRQDVRVVEPFGFSWIGEATQCQSCGRRTNRGTKMTGHNRDIRYHAWPAGLDGAALRASVVETNDGQGFTSNRELNVFWAWHPLGDDREWMALMTSTIRRWLLKMDTRSVKILVVPPGGMQHPEFEYIAHYVGLFLEMGEEMMQDAEGPYPSVRAEKALLEMVSGVKKCAIWHFWPAALLDQDRYLELGKPYELASRWASQSRSNIKMEV